MLLRRVVTRFVFSLLVVALLGVSVAQLSISGPRELSVPAGERVVVPFTIRNATGGPIEARLFLQDIVQFADGGVTFLEAGSLPESIYHLLSFEALVVKVPAASAMIVDGVVSVPQDAAGGFWGVVGVDVAEGSNGPGLRVRHALITSLVVEGVTRRDVGMRDVVQEGRFISFLVVNDGEALERVEVTGVFHAGSGLVAEASTSISVHPGNSLEGSFAVPESLPAGVYSVLVSSSSGGEPRLLTVAVEGE